MCVCVCLLLEKIICSPIVHTGSGAVTKEDFEKLFADTPSITDHNIHSEMAKLEAGLSDPKTDWSKHLILVGVAMCRSCDVTIVTIVTTIKGCGQHQYRANGWLPT